MRTLITKDRSSANVIEEVKATRRWEGIVETYELTTSGNI